MRISLVVSIILLAFIIDAQAQQIRISGRIFDQETNEPLAFVNVFTTNRITGSISGIDGRFELWLKDSVAQLSFSYVGYRPKTLDLTSENWQNLKIYLQPTTVILDEILVKAGENPALPLVRRVLANRAANDPQNLPYYRVKTYNKFYLQPEYDDEDSDTVKAVLMESVTEKKYKRPGLVDEDVLANRVSGLQDLRLTTLANTFQPFSFYDERIEVLSNRYLNPVSSPGLKAYFFSLEDTLFTENDTTYLVYFEPKTAGGEDLMEGVLYINTDNWALQNVIAEAESNNTRLKFQQQYRKVDRTWFPHQLNTNLYFKLDDTTNLQGIGRSYLFDIDLTTPVKSVDIDRMALEFDPEANFRSQDYWQAYRYEPLTERDLEIYEKMDSIGRAQNLDLQIKSLTSLLMGRVPIGKVDLLLNHIFGYNRLEKVRLGLGLATNDRFSPWIHLNGYAAYGFGDQRWKFGGGIDLSPWNFNDLTLHFRFKNDLQESGEIDFYPPEKSLLNPENFRNFYVVNLDRIRLYEGGFSLYLLKFLNLKAMIRSENREVTNNYLFNPALTGSDTSVATNFDFAEAGFQLRYAFGEQQVEVLGYEIPTESKFPVFWLNIFRGLDGPLEGAYQYWKLEWQLHQDWTLGKSGQSSLRLMGGYIDREIPAPALYYGYSSYYQKLALSSAYSFQTMRMNEFLSDRFINVFWRQNLGKLYETKMSAPQLVISGSAGWGDLQSPSSHNFEFKTMEKGFYEAGLELPYLLKGSFNGIGIGGFYRLGPYRLNSFRDNFVFRLNVLFGF